MSNQPEAQRPAEWIESDMTCQGDAEIAAELRRLHALNGELLEALRNVLKRSRPNGNDMTLQRISAIAASAIERAEGKV